MTAMTASITIVDNLWAVAEAEDTSLTDVRNLLKFRPQGYMFSPAYKARAWDGYISLVKNRKVKPTNYTSFDPASNYACCYIPAGLVSYVMDQPWAKNFHLRDLRRVPKCLNIYPTGMPSNLPWSPDQELAVELAIQAGRGIIQYPTGIGKGRIIGETIRRLQRPAFVLVDKVDLLTQLGDQIELALDVPVGHVGGGRADWEDCTIATFQSLHSGLEDQARGFGQFLDRYPVVIVDEAQHVGAKTYDEVMQNLPEAYYRLGFSATPFKSYAGKSVDRGAFLKTQAQLGPPIATMSISEGQETGRIVAPDIFIVHGCLPYSQSSMGLIAPTNYREERLYNIESNFLRNNAIIHLAQTLAFKRGEPTVILVESIKHGEWLEKCLALIAPPTGPTLEYLHGATKDRDISYKAFREGDLPLLIISKIANEALDLPNMRNLILAGGGRADYIQTQRLGRAMRAAPGKTSVTVFDFEDYGKYIASHYRRRRRAYESEPGYNVIDIDKKEIEQWIAT